MIKLKNSHRKNLSFIKIFFSPAIEFRKWLQRVELTKTLVEDKLYYLQHP